MATLLDIKARSTNAPGLTSSFPPGAKLACIGWSSGLKGPIEKWHLLFNYSYLQVSRVLAIRAAGTPIRIAAETIV